MNKNIDPYYLSDALEDLWKKDNPQESLRDYDELDYLISWGDKISENYSYLVQSTSDTPEKIYMSRQIACVVYFMWRSMKD